MDEALSNQENGRGRVEGMLKTYYAVTRALAGSDRLREAAPKILRAVCESLDWEVGFLWRAERGAGALRCVESWHAPGVEAAEFADFNQRQPFIKGFGLPGQVWETGEPAWITDMVKSEFPRAASAEQDGLHGAFAFPVTMRGEVLGVMEFFSREVRAPERDVLDMLEGIGSQVGQFIERKAAEEAQAERVRMAVLGADIGTALTQADDLREMLQRCAETLVKHLDAAFARIWTLNEAANV